jgi:hypothetical protein
MLDSISHRVLFVLHLDASFNRTSFLLLFNHLLKLLELLIFALIHHFRHLREHK